MNQDYFSKIKSAVLKKHYEDKIHYSSQPGSVASDIKEGIHMVIQALESVDLDGYDHVVFQRASEILKAKYKDFSNRPEVISDKIDKYGFTCSVLRNCSERFSKLADENGEIYQKWSKIYKLDP